MKLPLKYLETLIVVAEKSNFREAAEALNVTQPALSMQIKNIEQHFEIPIFEYTGKKKVLTAYGRLIYQNAKHSIDSLKLAFEDVDRQFTSGENLSLKISGRREVLQEALKFLNFKGRILITPTDSKVALKALSEREIDIAISRYKINSHDYVAKKFLVNGAWLVVHSQLAKNYKAADLAQNRHFLTDTPLLVYSEGNEYMSNWLEHLNISKNDLKIKYVCEDWLTILQLVENGKGYAIIPDSIKSNLKEVLHIKINNPVIQQQTYFFIYRKSLTKMPHFKSLFEW